MFGESQMPERILQLRFNDRFNPDLPEDVTPPGFVGLEPEKGKSLGRFVREVAPGYQIKSPTDAAQYLLENIYHPFESLDQEEMWVLLLDNRNRITHEVMVYRGMVHTTYVRMGELLKEANRQNAAAIIVSHCHPSGDPTPSPQDIAVTEQLVNAGELLDIPVLDHVIVGREKWVSMKEKGLGFPSQALTGVSRKT